MLATLSFHTNLIKQTQDVSVGRHPNSSQFSNSCHQTRVTVSSVIKSINISTLQNTKNDDIPLCERIRTVNDIAD